MKLSYYNKLFFILGILAFANSCLPYYVQTQSPENELNNVAAIYNPTINSLHPSYHIFRRDEKTSIIVAKVYKSEILINDANTDKINRGKVQFALNLYKIENDTRTLVDTLRFSYDVELKPYENVFIAQMTINTEPGVTYSLHIIYNDLLKQKFTVSYIDIENAQKNTGQNYLVSLNHTSVPAFKTYFADNEYFKITENFLQDSILYVEYFDYTYPLPRPPASITQPELVSPKPDTVYLLNARANSLLMQQTKGMYRYTKDTATHNGLTLFTFQNKYYPRVKTSQDMLQPIRYLVSEQEFGKLSNVTNTKYALDKFWLSLALGDKEKARELIKIFYTRVVLANNYFTSYTEGWRTDRGMIYIIYGPPKVIQKNHLKEKWIYGNTQSAETLAFTFYKRDHQFSTNHFELLRNNIYSASWRNAVKSWRAGNPFYGGN